MSDATPVIDIHGLRFAYPDGTQALDGVDLSVGRGESVALLGPNGAGKSTLLLHLNGILRAAAGDVRVDGMTIDDRSIRQVRSRVGMVFQDPDDQLFMTTLADDVAFGPLNMGLDHDEVERRVHHALHQVGLANEASRPAQNLSFGQRKRAAIATVLSMGPSLLVLDEPTSNLDPRARREMIALLSSLPATKVVATHDMDLALRLCRRALVVDGGRIVADGEARAIMSDEGLLARHGLEVPAALGGNGTHA